MAVNLGLLAGETLLAPLGNLTFQMRPHITGRDEATSGTSTRMGKAMEVMKNLTAKNGRYVGAEDACGIIAVELEARDLMRHVVQLGRGQELLGVRTGGLSLG